MPCLDHTFASLTALPSSLRSSTIALLAWSALYPQAQAHASEPLEPVTVTGHYDHAIGTADAASEGSVMGSLLSNRPTLRPAEVLEFVPGVIVTQHSGGGKANQYFLRGFNLDHGTDFATHVDGMPANMPTHAHGHGYTDLNWLIPELVQRIDYRKGPYAAEDGDFSSAGTARIRLADTLPQGLLAATVGQRGYRRALVANTSALADGQLLYALEASHHDGPWDTPENLRRVNGLLRYSVGPSARRTSITAMAYDARWNSTDQVPQRALDQGLIGRYGALDPSDGGQTSRYSLSINHQHTNDWGRFKANAYVVASRLELFSNFSFANDDQPDQLGASQFEQAEQRQVWGGALSQSWGTQLAGRDMVNTIGLQMRHDRLQPVGLYTSEGAQRTGTIQESRVRQSSLTLYADSTVQWQPWLRSVAGVRADHHDFNVSSSITENSGRASAQLTTPKLSLVFGPWARTEYFFNVGHGFHSNDARGATARIDANPPHEAVNKVDPLVRTKGLEVGVRTEFLPGLQSSLALWQLKLGSELLFVGDAGTTEANRASKRHGIEWTNHYVIRPGLLLDLDLAASKARFTQHEPEGQHIPGAIDKVASLGLTVSEWGPWYGQFQLRYFGPRPLIEDNTVRSRSTTLAYARVGYKISPSLKLDVDVFNLFNRKANDIEYYYGSRLPGEAGDVDDQHVHPVEPRSLRVTLRASF